MNRLIVVYVALLITLASRSTSADDLTTSADVKLGSKWQTLEFPTSVSFSDDLLIVSIELKQLQNHFETIVRSSGCLPSNSKSKKFGFGNFALQHEGSDKTRALGTFDISCQKWAWTEIRVPDGIEFRGIHTKIKTKKKIVKTELGKVKVRYSAFISVKPRSGDSVPEISISTKHKVVHKDAIAKIASELGLVNIGKEVKKASGHLRQGSIVRFREVKHDALNKMVAENVLVPKSASFGVHPKGKSLALNLEYTASKRDIELLKILFAHEETGNDKIADK